jgi:hypothetical protein
MLLCCHLGATQQAHLLTSLSVPSCCSEPTPAPVPSPPPARKKASVISVGEVKGTVYTSDGRRVASRDGALGDTLFEGDKLGTGQYVEVRGALAHSLGERSTLQRRVLKCPGECSLSCQTLSESWCVSCVPSLPPGVLHPPDRR